MKAFSANDFDIHGRQGISGGQPITNPVDCHHILVLMSLVQTAITPE